jgi:hypothetical protein
MPHDGVPFTEETMARFALLDRLRHPVWVFDIDARRVYWANTPALQVWEAASLDELCGRDMGLDMSDSVLRRLQQYQSDFISHDMMFSETWTLYPNGNPRNLQVVFSGLFHQGRMLMLCEALGELQADPEDLRSAKPCCTRRCSLPCTRPMARPVSQSQCARTSAGPGRVLANAFCRPG